MAENVSNKNSNKKYKSVRQEYRANIERSWLFYNIIQKIVQEQGGMSEEAAKGYVKALRTHKRYLADVY